MLEDLLPCKTMPNVNAFTSQSKTTWKSGTSTYQNTTDYHVACVAWWFKQFERAKMSCEEKTAKLRRLTTTGMQALFVAHPIKLH